MTKETDNNNQNAENIEENIGDITQTSMNVHKQYLKDLSFESPNAPDVFFQMKERPQMDMNLEIDVQKLKNEEHEHFYEVSLKINASAKQHNRALFITDIVYSAAVSITGLDEKRHHPLLFIEVPQLLFPYARQIISHVTNSGAFMPLQLAPVNFRQMYQQRFAPNAEQKDENAA